LTKVAVIGTTSWGTTLAVMLARKGLDVSLWARTENESAKLNQERQNQRFLPETVFPKSMNATHSLEEALYMANMILIAVPSGRFRENASLISPHLKTDCMILSATKGLETQSCKRMTEILEEELHPNSHSSIGVLSGPNLAKEIVQGMPASTVIASQNENLSYEAQRILNSDTFRVYTNTDVVGVELGGALKNIIAVGSGISDGLGYGNNSKAAFMTRGLVEITRLGVASGAKPLTFAGLTGLGDLIATCYSQLSRNRYVGEQLAKGNQLKKIVSSMENVAEGVNTTISAITLASRLGVDTPLMSAVGDIMFQGANPSHVVSRLMNRITQEEWFGVTL